jgi:hypothetical protein
MTMIAIVPETPDSPSTRYRAVAGAKSSVGPTAGQALDALNAQLDQEEKRTLVIVQSFQPDALFTAEQQQRLEKLMQVWRDRRDAGATLSPQEQSELERLIEAEVRAAADRARTLGRGSAR